MILEILKFQEEDIQNIYKRKREAQTKITWVFQFNTFFLCLPFIYLFFIFYKTLKI